MSPFQESVWLTPDSIPVVPEENMSALKAKTRNIADDPEFAWALSTIEALSPEARAAVSYLLRKTRHLMAIVSERQTEQDNRLSARETLLRVGRNHEQSPLLNTLARLDFEGSSVDQIQHIERLQIQEALAQMNALSSRTAEMHFFEAAQNDRKE